MTRETKAMSQTPTTPRARTARRRSQRTTSLTAPSLLSSPRLRVLLHTLCSCGTRRGKRFLLRFGRDSRRFQHRNMGNIIVNGGPVNVHPEPEIRPTGPYRPTPTRRCHRDVGFTSTRAARFAQFAVIAGWWPREAQAPTLAAERAAKQNGENADDREIAAKPSVSVEKN